MDALRYLINCHGECEWLDYKEVLNLERDADLAHFSRDALALKNTGGGYIVVGVRDQTWEPVGLTKRFPFDSKQLRDKVRHCTNVELDVDVVSHKLGLENSTGLFALILVRASRKRSKLRSPTVVGKDFRVTEKYGLRRGEIYARRGDSTVRVTSQDELVTLLERLEEEADHDNLLVAQRRSPFAVEDGTYRLLEKGFGRFIGRSALRERVVGSVTQDPRIWIVNVHGPGGVGKTALVNWATYQFYSTRQFEAIVQLSAKETALTEGGISLVRDPFTRSSNC